MLLEKDIGNGIIMKILEKREAKEFYEYVDRNRTQSQKWVPFVSKTKTIADAESYLIKFLEIFKNGEGYFWGLWDKNRIIGFVLIKDIDLVLSVAEIGYMIDKEYEGKGIIKITCDLMIDYVFDVLNLNKIRICCHEENTKSSIFPKKYGFKLEGIIRNDLIINGEKCNIMYWGLLKDERKKI